MVAASTYLDQSPARADAAPVGEGWRTTLELGTTAIVANNVMPVPAALGLGVLFEYGSVGIEGAMHVDAATLCDSPSGEGSCGVVSIWDVAPRFTLAPRSRFSPYLNARFQLIDSDKHGVVPAAGPRLGVRYRGQQVGFYLEAGLSFVGAGQAEIGGFTSKRDWFPQVSAGVTYTFR
jgi:hypothetical protein